MSEEIAVDQRQAVKKSPSRKRVRYRLTRQGKVAAAILMYEASRQRRTGKSGG